MDFHWKDLRHKIDSLSLRERQLIALTSVIMLLSCITVFVLVPFYVDVKKIGDAIDNKIEIIESYINGIDKIKNLSKKDVNKPYQNRLLVLMDKVNRQDEELSKLTSSLIKPDKMRDVFKGLLVKSNLKLILFKNVKSKKVSLKGAEENILSLHKHTFEIEMAGDYLSIVKFIDEIERNRWQLNWNKLVFNVDKYPLGNLKINVHTLSTSKKVFEL